MQTVYVTKLLELVKKYEGFSAKAYLCPAGVPTIGYGRTGNDVWIGMPTTTIAIEDKKLQAELLDLSAQIYKALAFRQATPTDAQLVGLTAFAYNCGFKALMGSTIVKMHEQGRVPEAAQAFSMWNKARVNGVLTPLLGLTRRRAEEAKHYLNQA